MMRTGGDGRIRWLEGWHLVKPSSILVLTSLQPPLLKIAGIVSVCPPPDLFDGICGVV